MRQGKKYTVRTANWLQGIAGRINAAWIDIKYRLAVRMEGKFSNYSKKNAIALLAVFCLASAALLTLFMVNGVSLKSNDRVNIQRISNVGVVPAIHETEKAKSHVIPNRLKAARKYLDSLAQDPKGKAIYDSLITARPGLMDSLKKAEYYYKP